MIAVDIFHFVGHLASQGVRRPSQLFIYLCITLFLCYYFRDYFASMVSDGKHVMINRLSRCGMRRCNIYSGRKQHYFPGKALSKYSVTKSLLKSLFSNQPVLPPFFQNSHSKYRLSSARPRPFYLHWIARASVRSAATNIVEETLNRHSCPELHGDSFWRYFCQKNHKYGVSILTDAVFGCAQGRILSLVAKMEKFHGQNPNFNLPERQQLILVFCPVFQV